MKHSLAAKFFTALLTTVLFWGIALGVYWLHQRQVVKKIGQDRYRITSIASVPCSADALPHNILISLLGLSEASFLYDQRADHWKQLLSRCPAVLQARTWLMPPQTIGIEYKLREPIAFIGGVKNVGIDENGAVFFMAPFFSIKRLPILTVNLGAFENIQLLQQKVSHSKEVLIGIHLIKKMSCLSEKCHLRLAFVDMSAWFDTNFFRKEVIVGFSQLYSNEKVLYVRIHPKNLRESLQLLEIVLPKLEVSSFRGGVVDMRFDAKILCSGEIAA